MSTREIVNLPLRPAQSLLAALLACLPRTGFMLSLDVAAPSFRLPPPPCLFSPLPPSGTPTRPLKGAICSAALWCCVCSCAVRSLHSIVLHSSISVGDLTVPRSGSTCTRFAIQICRCSLAGTVAFGASMASEDTYSHTRR